MHEQIDKLSKPVDKGEWDMTPQTVNAYYNPLFNEIVFPAGILQPPYYNYKADEEVNYGAIGAVIGIVITDNTEVSLEVVAGKFVDCIGWQRNIGSVKFIGANGRQDRASCIGRDPVLRLKHQVIVI